MADPKPPTRASQPRFSWWSSSASSSASAYPLWFYLAGAAVSLLAALALVDYGPRHAILVVAAACALGLVARPYLALCAVVSLISFEAIDTIRPSEVFTFTGIKLFGLVLVLSLVPEVLMRRFRMRTNTGLVVISFFFLGIVGSLVDAVNLRSSLSGILTFAQLAVLWAAAQYLVNDRERLRTLGKVAVITLLFSALLAIWQFLIDPEARVSGTSQNAAILSADLFVALGFAFALFLTTVSRTSQWGWAATLGLLGLGILVTLSRAAYVAFFPALLVGSLFMGKGGRGMLVMLATALVLFFLAPFAVERLAETSFESDASTRGHMYSISAGAGMMGDHPFFGVGIGNYKEHYLRYTNDERGLPRSAHNSYLAIGAEMGVPALLAFLLLHFFAFRTLWARSRFYLERHDESGLIWTGAIAFMLAGFSLIGLLHSLEISKYLWIILALALQPPEGGRRSWS